jgi:hypothetical protein
VIEGVWIFHADNGRFASGVFTSQALAEERITKHELSGVLTLYPLDMGVYEWAIEQGFLTPKSPTSSRTSSSAASRRRAKTTTTTRAA